MTEESSRTTPTAAINIVQEIIDYIEDNLLGVLTSKLIAGQFYLSVSELNVLFKLACGISVMEYVRNRRLTLAGEELMNSNIPIIDLALKYGYETPEAFTKAFARFHGFPPGFVRRAFPVLKAFHPLQIRLELLGGWEAIQEDNRLSLLTNQNSCEQEKHLQSCYDRTTKYKGGIPMENVRYHIRVRICSKRRTGAFCCHWQVG